MNATVGSDYTLLEMKWRDTVLGTVTILVGGLKISAAFSPMMTHYSTIELPRRQTSNQNDSIAVSIRLKGYLLVMFNKREH